MNQSTKIQTGDFDVLKIPNAGYFDKIFKVFSPTLIILRMLMYKWRDMYKKPSSA